MQPCLARGRPRAALRTEGEAEFPTSLKQFKTYLRSYAELEICRTLEQRKANSPRGGRLNFTFLHAVY
eukprot:g10786.t1